MVLLKNKLNEYSLLFSFVLIKCANQKIYLRCVGGDVFYTVFTVVRLRCLF